MSSSRSVAAARARRAPETPSQSAFKPQMAQQRQPMQQQQPSDHIKQLYPVQGQQPTHQHQFAQQQSQVGLQHHSQPQAHNNQQLGNNYLQQEHDFQVVQNGQQQERQLQEIEYPNVTNDSADASDQADATDDIINDVSSHVDALEQARQKKLDFFRALGQATLEEMETTTSKNDEKPTVMRVLPSYIINASDYSRQGPAQ